MNDSNPAGMPREGYALPVSLGVSPEQRAEWKRLAEDATPGPWEVQRDGHLDECGVSTGAHGHRGPFADRTNGTFECPSCRFIAAAREAVPALLSALEQVEARLARLDGETP